MVRGVSRRTTLEMADDRRDQRFGAGVVVHGGRAGERSAENLFIPFDALGVVWRRRLWLAADRRKQAYEQALCRLFLLLREVYLRQRPEPFRKPRRLPRVEGRNLNHDQRAPTCQGGGNLLD